jgi:hypothetical protein
LLPKRTQEKQSSRIAMAGWQTIMVAGFADLPAVEVCQGQNMQQLQARRPVTFPPLLSAHLCILGWRFYLGSLGWLLLVSSAAWPFSIQRPTRHDVFSPNKRFVLDVNPTTNLHHIYAVQDRTKPLWSFTGRVGWRRFLLADSGQPAARLHRQ